MKAFILAAGKGERLRPLTLKTPKPLVKVKDKPLLQWHLEALRAAGISDIVINVSWLRNQIIDFVAQDQFADLSISISDEEDEPLETGGGMLKALPLLGEMPFLVVNADVFTDFNYKYLPQLNAEDLAHLVLVNNPDHNPKGDFSIRNGRLSEQQAQKLTYSGIGLYSPKLFELADLDGKFSVVPLIKQAIKLNKASAKQHTGIWNDIGSPERLAVLNGSTLNK
ncbi:N-acetylmuramate alpha-1-phosphate uridylyltransferase MurU [Marinicella rhabdoformis]|uniref:N-acetylmuramate alpha-1-phosphate uridylyltransferase MurU n=1 Tax=Marinicella rhabdoformis TaxID=2580566 RepID=UPI0012AEC74E|nr:nucleotidyltransferase family protein [Marinicella rhabdoformis]